MLSFFKPTRSQLSNWCTAKDERCFCAMTARWSDNKSCKRPTCGKCFW